MKTKHLFFAAALAASFTACTNDDIVDVQQQGAATVERATVENVQLNFVGEGVGSRLAYDGKYAWEATDTIGALLMDQPTGTGKMWHEQYTLSQWVNTSYPFTYSTEDNTWSCPGKMLEGNYFFAYPFSSYDGGRTMNHSLLNQSQKGIKSNVVREALASNQIFIGYSQIKKGTAFDVLEDVEMTSVLGALQLRIKNTSDKTYHVNKFVVRGEDDIISELTFDPTNAKYAGTLPEDELTLPSSLDDKFSYKNGSNYFFNYANYVADEENKTLYNIEEENAKYYNRAEALRKVVNGADDARNVIYLNVEGTAEERAWAKGQTAYALIMVNPLAEFEGTISVEVYTDEGAFIAVESLSQAETLNNEPITALLPGVSATVVDVCDFEEIVETETFDIYTAEDMLQFIAWNKTITTTSPVSAALHTDIELTKEMFDDMKSAAKVTWNFVGAEQATPAAEDAAEEEPAYKLILAEDLPANVLNYKKLVINDNLDVIVEGTIDFTQTIAVDEITIEEGATMNIKVAVNNKSTNDTDVKLPKVINKGTLNIAGVQVLGAGNITNEAEGIINVVANADVKGAADVSTTNNALVNKGIINNAGYMQYVKNNAGATMNLTGAAVLKNLTNAAADTENKLAEGKINAAAGTSVSGTNAGLIACADETVVVSSGIGGRVALEVTGAVAKNKFENKNYNTLIIKGATTFADIQNGIKHIITTDGSELKLAAASAAYTLSLESLEINGATTLTTVLSGTTANEVKTLAMDVKKGATLTNNGTLKVTTTWANEGLVINNQSAALPAGSVSNPGSWKFNDPTAYDAGKTAASKTLKVLAGQTLKSAKEALDAEFPTNTVSVGALELYTSLDMSLADNNYASYFGENVTLYDGAELKNVKPSLGINGKKLIVKGNAKISGTALTPIVKFDEVKIEKTGSLTMTSGYLELDQTSNKNFGCEYIVAEGFLNAPIAAKNADSEYLFWNGTQWGETPLTVDATFNADTKVTVSMANYKNILVNTQYHTNVEFVEDITLDEPLEISRKITINTTNLYRLVYTNQAENTTGNAISEAVLVVKDGADVTWSGNITAGNSTTGAAAEMTEANLKKNVSVAPVHVLGGKLTIKSGVFSAGYDIFIHGVPVIEAKAGTTVNIEGGTFKANKPCEANGKTVWTVLNRWGAETTGIFNVKGGTFHNYNPAAKLTHVNGYEEAACTVAGAIVKKNGTATTTQHTTTDADADYVVSL